MTQQFYLFSRANCWNYFQRRCGLSLNNHWMAHLYFIFSLFPPGVWLPQHVHMGGQRLVCLQGDPLALQEVLLSASTWEAAGPCAHLNTVSTEPRPQDTCRHMDTPREVPFWGGVNVRALECNTRRYSWEFKKMRSVMEGCFHKRLDAFLSRWGATTNVIFFHLRNFFELQTVTSDVCSPLNVLVQVKQATRKVD